MCQRIPHVVMAVKPALFMCHWMTGCSGWRGYHCPYSFNRGSGLSQLLQKNIYKMCHHGTIFQRQTISNVTGAETNGPWDGFIAAAEVCNNISVSAVFFFFFFCGSHSTMPSPVRRNRSLSWGCWCLGWRGREKPYGGPNLKDRQSAVSGDEKSVLCMTVWCLGALNLPFIVCM